MHGKTRIHPSDSHLNDNSPLRVRAAVVGPPGAEALGVLRVFALQPAKIVLEELEASRDAADARLAELLAQWDESGNEGRALICLRRASDNTHSRLTWRRRGQAKKIIELGQLSGEEQEMTDMRFALRLEEQRLVGNLRFACLGYEIQRLEGFITSWRKLQDLRRRFFPPRTGNPAP